MKTILKFSLPLLLFSTILVSCSSKGLIEGYWDTLPKNIDSINTFMKAWLILVLIDFSISGFLNIIIGLKGRLVTIILFFCVLFMRDYGFFTTVFLFLFSGIVLFLVNFFWKLYVANKK
jgi:hypothetical protein